MFDGTLRMHNSQQFVGGNKHLYECDLSSSETKARRQCCVPAVVPDRDHHSLFLLFSLFIIYILGLLSL